MKINLKPKFVENNRVITLPDRLHFRTQDVSNYDISQCGCTTANVSARVVTISASFSYEDAHNVLMMIMKKSENFQDVIGN